MKHALDLFCGAGGATRGLQMAGFHVTGVDIRPQPHYCGDEFKQADALTWGSYEYLHSFDFVWASPPCQGYSRTRKIMEGKGIPNPRACNLIPETRGRLEYARVPYVIENVPGAPLISPFLLCGTMFGLRVYRHRLFETRLPILLEGHPVHNGSTGSHRGYSHGYPYITVGGHNYNASAGKQAMQIDWMTRDELNEAIPPVYSEFIGRQVMELIA